MKNLTITPVLIFLLAVLTSSCLTVEKKEYTFKLKNNHSGELTIKFINIISMMDDTADISASDFEELITGYIDGDQLEQDYADATLLSKKLFEENGTLCGEVIIEFNDLKSVGLFQYDSKGPYMFNMSSFLEGESYLSSNGEYGGDVMPVVFWDKSLKELTVSTYISNPDESCISLLDEYNNWK